MPLRLPEYWICIKIKYSTRLITKRDFITGVGTINKTNNVDMVSSWWQIIWWKIFDCVRINILHLFVFLSIIRGSENIDIAGLNENRCLCEYPNT